MTVWQPGMRCVFIGVASDPKVIANGIVYTVRWVGEACFGEGELCLALKLHEIVRPPVLGFEDYPFAAQFFRPLSETRLDQFRKLLAPVDTRETV